jgi:hypothetical protein
MGEFWLSWRRMGLSPFLDVAVLPKDNASSKRDNQEEPESTSQNRDPGSFWAFLLRNVINEVLETRRDCDGVMAGMQSVS